MYRRRKKIEPQASSTLVGTASLSSLSQTQTSSYTESDSSFPKPQSQKDLFTDSESISAINVDNKQKSTFISPGNQKTVKSAAESVLNMLTTPPNQDIPSLKEQTSAKEIMGSSSRITLKTSNDFAILLKETGLLLSEDSAHNVLFKDQAVFVRDLTKKLKTGGENTITRFMKYLEQYLSDKECFQKSLTPTKTDVDSNIARGEFQECLIRLLLSVTVLQTRIAQYLLDRLADLILSDPEQSYNEGIMWVRLILPPMRYLPITDKSTSHTKTLFDIIHAVPVNMVQHEIINYIPDIIGDDQLNTVANELMEVMKWKPLLTPSVLTALGNLCLEGTSLYEVKLTLIKSLRREPLDHLPAFVNFICKPPVDTHIDEFLNGLRSELVICHAIGPSLTEYMRSRGANNADINSTLIKLFENMKDLVLGNVKLADAWLKNILKVKNYTLHKPIDLVMSLLIHSTSMCPSKKKMIETAVRSRIRHGFFKHFLIKDTISALVCVLKQNFNGLLKFLSALLQSSDVVVSNFASLFFADCFVHMDKDHCRAIILELMDNVRRSSGCALNLLYDLTVKHTAKIAPFLSLIMRLIDIVSELNVFEVRQLMDIICIIAFGDPDDLREDPTSLQNDIYMIVQKQLSCPDPAIFKSGVICSLITIKHMVTIKNGEPNETPNTEELHSKEGESSTGQSIEIQEKIVLNSRAVKAHDLLEMVLAATHSNSEANELFYDQLSYIILSSDNMDKAFMKKVSLEMQNNLQNNYIIAASEFSVKNDDLEATLQFCIDTELEDPIVLNITDAVVKESKQKSSSIHNLVALPGLLRVIRGLQLADLSEIDALLGCYISFPQQSLFSTFSTLELDVQIIIMDCLFHTCNWFREILNSFVYLIKESSAEKVLIRLRLVVHLQGLIATCLPQAIGYTPPKYIDLSKGSGQLRKKIPLTGLTQKRPKKKKKGSSNSSGSGETKTKSNGTEDNEGGNNCPATQTQADESSTDDDDSIKQIVIEFSYFQQYLRELDFDVCLLLTQSLTLQPLPQKDGKFSAEFGPNELMLLLDDLNSKLVYRLKPKTALARSREKKELGFNNFLNVPIDLIIRNTTKLISHITNHLHKIVEYCYNLLKEHDGIYDALGMFCTGTTEIKKCSALIFSICDSFFSWPELKSDAYMKCLIKAAMKLGGEAADKSKSKENLNYALQSSINYLLTISKYMLDLASAINLVTLIKTLDSLQEEGDDKKETEIGDLCNQFLKRKWYDSKGIELKGNELNKHQACLLELYLISGEDSLDNIKTVVTSLTEEMDALNRTETIFTLLPHFNKSNLHVLIRSITKCLYTICKNKMEITDLKEQFTFWDNIVDCLQGLVHVVKVHDGKVNLRQLLKGCFPILRLFKSNGMTVCSNMFKLDAVLVTQTIKKLQVVTRYIQSVCNYSKVTKDRALLLQLPGIRGVLESIVLSVKNMILQNKCVEAFFMGSMKNKDHHGEIIPSQDSIDTTSTVGGSEDLEEEGTGLENEAEEEHDDSESDNSSVTDITAISEAF